ncbi:MAG TPA: hypothetical protein VD816_12345 [Ohtaekwangia sp.]|nr:hypothetical protein [Ohtaekwangia sp.]
MNKARITSPAAMREDQVKEDIAMTPSERLDLAFQITDFANEICANPGNVKDKSSSVHWIDVGKIPS